MTREQRIPHDLDAEAGVLGALLHRGDLISRLPTLEVEDFYSPQHQAVFVAMRNLELKLQPLDCTTVNAELERMGRAQAVGGVAFLGELATRCPDSANVEHYARIMADHRMSRDVARACSAIIEDIRIGELVGTDAIGVAVRHLMGIQSRVPDASQTMHEMICDELGAIARDMAALDRGEPLSVGVPTGIASLDDETGGNPIGSVTVYLGATGHGKSTLMGTGARAGAAAGDLVLVYSLEDPKRFWRQRGLAQETGVPTEAIARRRGLSGSMRRLNAARMTSAGRTERVIPAANWTVDEIIRDVQARRLRDQAILGGKKRRCSVWVDYLQALLLVPERNSNREQAIHGAMLKLSWLAAGCGSADPADECAVIAASQVKQAVIDEKRPPRMNDGADSFAIAKQCKFMLGINRPSKYDKTANRLLGRVDVLKRNQGDDECHADVVLNLATHTITAVNAPREPDAQANVGGF